MTSNRLLTKYDKLVYDVGMHKGEDTGYYLKKGFKVIAFEANPGLIEDCKKKFAKEISEKNLIIIEGAIVENAIGQTIKFYMNKEMSVWGTINESWARRNTMFNTESEIIEVRAIDFKEILKEHGVPYYMKIDIEGSDIVCLSSLTDFELKPAYISIESEKVVFTKLLEEIDLLDRLGYREFKAVQQANIEQQAEPNPAKEGIYTGHQFELGASGMFGEDLPGRWKNKREICNEYRLVFLLYKLFGDAGTALKHPLGRYLRYLLQKKTGRPIPGWYDTHAKHSSICT